MHILAIGECMAELAPGDRAGDYRLGFAGDTFNTAWYLARLDPDLEVSYLTAIGTDAISDRLASFMADSGIGTRFLRTASDKTLGLYLITLENGERSFSYWRGQSAARTLADDPGHLAEALDRANLIYVSGITLAILEPKPRATLLGALNRARADGRTIAFDPNLRPRLWPSPAEMTRAIMEGAAVSDIVLPSFEDEASWFGDPSPEATARRYEDAGARTVIVKNGADSVLYRQGTARGTVPVSPVAELVDSTAAGDSFNAGVLAALARGQSLEDAIAQACALSREVVQRKGALVPVAGGAGKAGVGAAPVT